MRQVKTDTLKGTVLEIQRMSTEDGPGIRTTVFMKGCPLSCVWCHNPESILSKPQVHWLGIRCIGCGICTGVCAQGAIKSGEEGITIDRGLCTGCGLCTEECPATALELLGKKWRVKDLFDEIIKDRAYFENSSGGVTFSGGESTLQHEFLSAILMELKSAGVYTAVDTCGLFGEQVYDSVFPYADIILYDLKEIDTALHKKFTGSGNEQILKNLTRTAEYVRDRLCPREIWIRTPVIPGATARPDNISGIGKFISSLPAGTVRRWDLCAFNNLCADKYARLGEKWEFEKAPLIEKQFMEELAERARGSVADPGIVSWSGSTR